MKSSDGFYGTPLRYETANAPNIAINQELRRKLAVNMIDYTVDQNIAIITWAMTSSPMNVLNDESIPAFDAALQRAHTDEAVQGVIITSSKSEFVAGADLKMILRNNDKDPADMLPLSSELNRIFRRIELAGKPTVAAINGTALGGGYEICLACHHRIALNNPKTLIGLVEVTIGLLPGAGGTQRLPRMLGAQVALPLLLEGKKAGVQEAKRLGMIDCIADSPAEMIEKARAWIVANPKPIKPWDKVDPETGELVGLDRFTPPGGDVRSAAVVKTFSAERAGLMAKTKGNYPAPLEIMACVYEGLQVDIDQGLMIEAEHFARVATSKVAGNLIKTMFLGLNEVNKGARRPKNLPRTDVKKLGILGASLMGTEIAGVSALGGIEVMLKGTSAENAELAKSHLRQRLEKGVERGTVDPQQVAGIVALLKPTTDAHDLAGCDLIMGSNDDAQEFFSDNVPVLAINALPGTESSTPAVGLRFFSPVEQSTLVEIITNGQTPDYALAVAMDYVRKIRKTPIVVRESPGGYVARCLSAYSDEGQELLREGVSPELIENAGEMAGMPTGPLTVPKYLAQKPSGVDSVNRLETQGHLHRASHTPPTLDDLKTRLLYRQVIEAVRCFEADVVSTTLEANLGSILGWGFPSYTGGALAFVDFVGIETFVRTADRLADTYGDRFRPTEKLRERVSQ